MRFVRTALTLAMALSAPVAWSTDLVEVYELAYASDPTLQAAEATRYSVAEGTVQARALLLPQVSGSYSWSNTDSESVQTSLDVESTPSTRDADSRDLRLRLDQTIYDRSNYTRLAGARANTARAEADYDAAVDSLLLRTTEAYFNVLTAQDGLAFAVAQEKAVRRQLDQAEQRFEVGLSAITDVHEAQARADQSRASAILAENDVEDALQALEEIAGQPVTGLKRLRTDLNMGPPEPSVPDEWVQQAMSMSPSLRARELQLEGANHAVDTAKAGHYPTLSAFVTYSDNDTTGDRTFAGVPGSADSADERTTIGVTLNVPIYAGGATQSGVRQAVYDREAAVDNVEAERRAVNRSIRNAYRAVIAGISEVQARKQALVSAQSALEATEAGFEVGTRTIVDVLLSQQTLFQAQRDDSQARHNLVLNRLRLNQAAGTIELEDLRKINQLLVVEAAPPTGNQ